MNNRIGTPILKSEKDNLPLGVSSDITPGKMVVYQKRYEEYVWAVYMKEDGNKKQLLVDRNGNSIKSVFPHSLCEYNGGEILQTYKDNYKLNSDHRLDIYSI